MLTAFVRVAVVIVVGVCSEGACGDGCVCGVGGDGGVGSGGGGGGSCRVLGRKFGTSPRSWDSWDSWDSLDSWDSWDRVLPSRAPTNQHFS